MPITAAELMPELTTDQVHTLLDETAQLRRELQLMCLPSPGMVTALNAGGGSITIPAK